MKRKILTVLLLSLALCGCTLQEEAPNTQTASIEETSTAVDETAPSPTPTQTYGTDYQSTWGDLIAANGGEPVWGTLTKEQQALVNFPYLDKDHVFYVPEGNSYHSVEWCYTLERSETILSCSYDEALGNNLGPCSKCVEGE